MGHCDPAQPHLGKREERWPSGALQLLLEHLDTLSATWILNRVESLFEWQRKMSSGTNRIYLWNPRHLARVVTPRMEIHTSVPARNLKDRPYRGGSKEFFPFIPEPFLHRKDRPYALAWRRANDERLGALLLWLHHFDGLRERRASDGELGRRRANGHWKRIQATVEAHLDHVIPVGAPPARGQPEMHHGVILT